LQWQSKGTFAMSVKSDKSTHGTSISHFHALESLRETDSQIFSKLLLEELHNALSWQKQTLAEAAMEIQNLLKQLQETHPTATEAEQKAFVTAAIPLKRREQFMSALQAGWKEAMREFLDKSYLQVGIATLEEWKLAD
jgi:NAD-dependent oxidoreductase involved in siderophore biosynthesis